MSEKKLVIVVDDSHLVRLRVASALSMHGVKVVEMQRAEELLAGLKTAAQADLIILDLHLPGLDGLSVLEQLRRNEPTARVPVMILTVSPNVEDVRRAVQLGAVDYLLKPFADEALLDRVSRIIGPLKPLKTAGPPVAELRARLEEEVRKEVKRAKRAKTDLLLLKFLLPPDWGWERLVKLGEKVAAVLRETDTCLPFPGGGLAVILPLTPRQSAEVVAKKVSQVLIEARAGEAGFRLAAFPEDGADERTLLASLEKATEELGSTSDQPADS